MRSSPATGAGRNWMEFPMSFSRKAVLALTGIAALAMPLAVAGSASAATDARCTVTPLKPVFDHRNSSGETVTKYVLAVLPDADGWGDDNEEMYHSVGFQVTEDNGYVSQWTNWEDSAIVTFHL